MPTGTRLSRSLSTRPVSPHFPLLSCLQNSPPSAAERPLPPLPRPFPLLPGAGPCLGWSTCAGSGRRIPTSSPWRSGRIRSSRTQARWSRRPRPRTGHISGREPAGGDRPLVCIIHLEKGECRGWGYSPVRCKEDAHGGALGDCMRDVRRVDKTGNLFCPLAAPLSPVGREAVQKQAAASTRMADSGPGT